MLHVPYKTTPNNIFMFKEPRYVRYSVGKNNGEEFVWPNLKAYTKKYYFDDEESRKPSYAGTIGSHLKQKKKFISDDLIQWNTNSESITFKDYKIDTDFESINYNQQPEIKEKNSDEWCYNATKTIYEKKYNDEDGPFFGDEKEEPFERSDIFISKLYRLIWAEDNSKYTSDIVLFKNDVVNVPCNNSESSNSNQKNAAKSKNFYKIDIDVINDKRDKRKTCMIKNIPNNIKFNQLKKIIDSNFTDKYVDLNLMMDTVSGYNLGYAFISFKDVREVIKLYNLYNGKKWENRDSLKVIEITYARIQKHRNNV